MSIKKSSCGRLPAATEAERKTTNPLYHSSIRLPICCDDGQRILYCGEFLSNWKVFVKIIRPQHLLRKPPAICIQQSVLRRLEGLGCEEIHITLIGNKQITKFKTSFANFNRQSFEVDRGFGRQKALPLSMWKTEVIA